MMGSIDKQATIDTIYEKANEELADANHHFLAGVHMATDVVRDMPERRWIPCSEKLPERYDSYLITTEDEDTDIGTYHQELGRWSICDANGFHWKRVLAWMPLPEPYKEGEQHE